MFKFRKKKVADKHSLDPDSAVATVEPAESPATVEPDPPTTAAAVTDAPADAEDGGTGRVSESIDTPEDAPADSPATERSWRRRLAGSALARGLGALLHRGTQPDEDWLDELETVLITADVGVQTTTSWVETLRQRMHKHEFADNGAVLAALHDLLLAELEPVVQPFEPDGAEPFVLLVVGVNGVGKTTTIGKLAQRYTNAGRRVMLAAGDTFRAAAVEQLQRWGERAKVTVIAQGEGADSASVIFDALSSARARGCDLLLADTAGRLHTQGGLMDELAKVVRVIKKLDANAPHEVLMVIDGTTGQNAVNQVRQFREAVGVTGLAVTKLDGSAKGGVVFALAHEFGLPIRYVGLGEGIDDLQPFDPQRFVTGLLPADVTKPAP